MIAYDAPGFDASIIRDACIEEGRLIAADAQSRMSARGVDGTPRTVEAALSGDDVAKRIVETAREWQADAIVMGTHGRRGIERLVLGSVAERVLRSASCPVLMIPARAGAPNADPGTAPAAKEPT
jgi:nucleotide-binding universal stress UspA family protein